MNKKTLDIDYIKKILLKKGLTIKKNKKNIIDGNFKSLYLTALCSIFVIIFFYTIPIFLEFKENRNIAKQEITNTSKTNF